MISLTIKSTVFWCSGVYRTLVCGAKDSKQQKYHALPLNEFGVYLYLFVKAYDVFAKAMH